MALVLSAFAGGCASKGPVQASGEKVYSFWPPAPNAPRIQYLTTFNSSIDIAPEPSRLEKLVYGNAPTNAYPINKPYGVRMANGCIYVCDIRGGGLTVLDLRKQQTRVMGATGTTTIKKPVDLTITPDGMKYVVDSVQRAILVFDANEAFVQAFRMDDSAPVGIAAYENLLYVSDFKNAHVKVLDRATGRLIKTIGERGGDDGMFIGILGVATDKAGNLYVSDTIKCRIQKFAPDGTLLMAFGETGNRMGQFVRPKQLDVGSDGHIHVVDAAFNNVQVFDSEGKVVGYYGSLGRHPGAMDLPAGLDIHEADLDLMAKYVHPAFQPERLILVANQYGDQKVSVYAMGQLKPGKTAADIAVGRGRVTAGVEATTQPTTRPAVPLAK